ncbi:MAG TPA: FixH family protein [Polyangiaceae bacterium]|nr:FixH family protein [Polyangiaceae bacterium]
MAMTSQRAPLPPSGKLWAWAPGVLLAALLGTQLTVLHFVLDDPSFALEPDYYRKAVAWDRQRELERQSQALGWHAELAAQPALPAPPGSQPQPGLPARGLELRVQLRDAQQGPLGGAAVHVQAFANARAARVFEAPLLETAPGTYTAEIPSRLLGLWEFRLEATRGAERFAEVLRQNVSARPGSP